MLIVFLFLNSWRSTVITGLTLPIALIGTFLFMYLFGFTINSITLMALSLCVGLLIDDAIVVRENIVRHVQMGKSAHQAALDGTNEIGLAVLATTLSIVAVFLPIGFMGGIVGKFFHEFGITIVAAVLISMFVSFTLDPMLSSVWNDPQAHGVHRGPPVTLLRQDDRPRHAACSTASRCGCPTPTSRILRWSLKHKLATLALGAGDLRRQLRRSSRCSAPSSCRKADFSETQVNFYTPVGSSLEVTEARAKQVDAALREFPEVRLHGHDDQQRPGRGQDLRERLRAPDRPQGPQAQRRPAGGAAARAAGAHPRHHGHEHRRTDLGGGKSLQFSVQGSDLAELERLSRRITAQAAARSPAWSTWTRTLKPDKPTVAIEVRRDAASDLGPERRARWQARCARCWPGRRWATGARRTARTTTSTCAWRQASRRPGRPAGPAVERRAGGRRQPARRAAVAGGRRRRRRPGRTRSTGAT